MTTASAFLTNTPYQKTGINYDPRISLQRRLHGIFCLLQALTHFVSKSTPLGQGSAPVFTGISALFRLNLSVARSKTAWMASVPKPLSAQWLAPCIPETWRGVQRRRERGQDPERDLQPGGGRGEGLPALLPILNPSVQLRAVRVGMKNLSPKKGRSYGD